MYEVMKKQKNMLWFCSVCNPKVRKSLKELEKVKEENTEMKKELNSLKKENGVMAKKVEELEEKWIEGENRREEEQTDLKAELNNWKKMNAKWKEEFEKFEERVKEREEELVRRVTERVFEDLEEREDREKRKKNVIMFNVEESSKDDTKERETEDKELCEYVFQEKLGVEGARVEKVYRLGVRVRGRERPLVACWSEVYAKWEVIKRNKELRNVQEERVNRIRISVDKTKREREEDAKLKEKLQEKRREGGRWIIKRGKIVRVAGDQDTE